MNRDEYGADYLAPSYRPLRTAGHGRTSVATSRNDYDIDSMLSSRTIRQPVVRDEPSSTQPPHWNRRTVPADSNYDKHNNAPRPNSPYSQINSPSRSYRYNPQENTDAASSRREYSPVRKLDNARESSFKGFTTAFPSDDPSYVPENTDPSRRSNFASHTNDHLSSVSAQNYRPQNVPSNYEPRYRSRGLDYPADATRAAPDAKSKFEAGIRGEQRYNVDGAAGSIAAASNDRASSIYSSRARRQFPSYVAGLEETPGPLPAEHSLSPRSFKRECQKAFQEARAQRMRNLEEGLYGKCDWATFDSKYC